MNTGHEQVSNTIKKYDAIFSKSSSTAGGNGKVFSQVKAATLSNTNY
jgi:hypothetical protein